MPEAFPALRAGQDESTRSTYRAETERDGNDGAAAEPAVWPDRQSRSVSVHPIHTAGRYFACHDPEADWINDVKAAAPSGEDVSPDKEKARSV